MTATSEASRPDKAGIRVRADRGRRMTTPKRVILMMRHGRRSKSKVV